MEENKVNEQENSSSQQIPNIVINNNNSNVQSGMPMIGTKDKKVALLLCIFLGYLGAHKFYEGKAGVGIIYFFTGGVFAIMWIIDIISLLAKPDKYIP